MFDALGRSPPAKRTSQVDLQHHGGRRPVLPCVEDSVRRPQRPGNHSRAETRAWRIPPNDSPSRTAGHRRLCRNALAGHAERLARCRHLVLRACSHQGKILSPLCRNCECFRFLVEARGNQGPMIFERTTASALVSTKFKALGITPRPLDTAG